MGNFHEYLVVGRRLPVAGEPQPKIFRMRVFAPNQLVAESKFWYFMKRLKNVKRAHGEIIRTSEIFERKPTTVKNFGVWFRYDSRSGTHNMYKEYRELTRADAIAACYQDLAARHRARFRSVQIIRCTHITNSADIKRPYISQFINSKIRFPLPHRIVRASDKSFRTTFKATRPNTTF